MHRTTGARASARPPGTQEYPHPRFPYYRNTLPLAPCSAAISICTLPSAAGHAGPRGAPAVAALRCRRGRWSRNVPRYSPTLAPKPRTPLWSATGRMCWPCMARSQHEAPHSIAGSQQADRSCMTTCSPSLLTLSVWRCGAVRAQCGGSTCRSGVGWRAGAACNRGGARGGAVSRPGMVYTTTATAR